MEKRINAWLRRYARTYFDRDFGYADCDMIDGCLRDLGLGEDARALVERLVDEYIAEVA